MDEMVEWNHQLKGHEFEQAPGVGEGQGSLVCCSPWGHKESDMTEWLNCMDVPTWEILSSTPIIRLAAKRGDFLKGISIALLGRGL